MPGGTDLSGFDFSSSFRDISRGLILSPILHNYLFDARFPEFTLHFLKQEMERRPDDWFHPSTHPEWHERALYQYLAHPSTFPVEKKRHMSTLSVTMGSVMHEFIQICLGDAGVRPPELQVCTSCPPEAKCKEPGFADDELGERGHLDGLLDFTQIPGVPPEKQYPVFEFKTSHDNFGRLSGIDDLDLEAFRKRWPDYYGQQQRYLRLARRSWSVVLMMETVYPWVMKEFHVPLDLAYNQRIDDKYRRVRQAVADQRPPICCGSKGCPSAAVCVVR